jgi:hypothetical protein
VAIYSKKYGRSFKNRSELQTYAWWDYRTRPILPWLGVRDCLYSDQWRQERGLPPRGKGMWSWLKWVFVAEIILVWLFSK